MTHSPSLVGGYAATEHFREILRVVAPVSRKAWVQANPCGKRRVEGTAVFWGIVPRIRRFVVAGTSVAQRWAAQALDANIANPLSNASVDQETTE